MSGVYPFPEMDDVVYGYMKQVYDETDRPVTTGMIASVMNKDLPGSGDRFVIRDSLDSLADRRLISWEGQGYVPLVRSSALRRQVEMEEVRPFTREYGETPEAHEDRVWDFRTALTKPEAGGKWGLGATGHLIPSDRRWTGLTQEL